MTDNRTRSPWKTTTYDLKQAVELWAKTVSQVEKEGQSSHEVSQIELAYRKDLFERLSEKIKELSKK